MKRSKKGFTLAELLVVVAIIAVLVAIAIPVFTSSTKKAEEAVEVANARATYAEGMTAVVDGSYTDAGVSRTYGEKTYLFKYNTTNNTFSVTVTGGTVYNSPYTSFADVEITGATPAP